MARKKKNKKTLSEIKRYFFLDDEDHTLQERLNKVSQEVCDKLSKLHNQTQDLINKERSHLKSKA